MLWASCLAALMFVEHRNTVTFMGPSASQRWWGSIQFFSVQTHFLVFLFWENPPIYPFFLIPESSFSTPWEAGACPDWEVTSPSQGLTGINEMHVHTFVCGRIWTFSQPNRNIIYCWRKTHAGTWRTWRLQTGRVQLRCKLGTCLLSGSRTTNLRGIEF